MMEQLKKQQEMIEYLQNKMEEMALHKEPKTVIERIEYHFDQLKIETLEGTLQIGLTPNGSDLSDIEGLYKNQGQDPVAHSLQKYMTEEIPPWINQYVRDHDMTVHEEHKNQIIEDVRKQLPQRVNVYREQNPDMDDTALLHKIQTEIRDSIVHYFSQQKGDD
ncbi:spore gernimation protein GerPC [Halobacillus fulvus]|nr:spore gernimation protein GerPC [Halobacillus fulvus]